MVIRSTSNDGFNKLANPHNKADANSICELCTHTELPLTHHLIP